MQDLFQDDCERLDQNGAFKGSKASNSKVLYTKEQRRNVVCYKCNKKVHIQQYWRSDVGDAQVEGDSNSSGNIGSRGSDKNSG